MAKREDRAGRLYDEIRQMAENFQFKPEAQINEVALAQKFGTSRTPVREALNRLVAEGFMTFQARKGFFCRPLSRGRILSLYEARVAVETEAVRLALVKSNATRLQDLDDALRAIISRYHQGDREEGTLALDEQFHTEIARYSRNPELVRILGNLNARIRFVRLIDHRAKYMTPASSVDDDWGANHDAIRSNIAARDIPAAMDAMRSHIECRMNEAAAAVARAYAEIYNADDEIDMLDTIMDPR